VAQFSSRSCSQRCGKLPLTTPHPSAATFPNN
jgi:hypothetical protein